jgi:hypothetical protein
MVFRSLRRIVSIDNFSFRLRSNNSATLSKDQSPNQHLIWILLAPARNIYGDDAYIKAIDALAEAITAHNYVSHITKLRAIVPSCTFTQTNLTSTTSGNALLITITDADSDSMRSAVATIENILTAHNNPTCLENKNNANPIFAWKASLHHRKQSCSPPTSKEIHGTCVVTVLIHSPDQAHAADTEAWYRREQLPLLGKHSPNLYLRSRRYHGIDNADHADTEDDVEDRDGTTAPSSLTTLAVHEYVSVEALLRYSLDHGQVVPETQWSRRVLGSAGGVERTVWEVV